jgi:hypothetical protein
MAAVTKSAKASADATTMMIAPQITGLLAGEPIPPCSPCEIRADGRAWRASAAAADTHAAVAGWCPKQVQTGQPVTLFGVGLVMKYSDGLLTPGQRLYLAAAAPGALDTAATVGDAVGLAQAIDANNIRVTRNI